MKLPLSNFHLTLTSRCTIGLVLTALVLVACQSAPQTRTPAAVGLASTQPGMEPSTAPTISPQPEATQTDMMTNQDPAFTMNARLGRGINLGNALEAPSEGEWGVILQEDYFTMIKEKGFDSVRVPIRWSTHAEATAPYTIDPKFFERVDWIIEQALANDLAVIINFHHYEEIHPSPQGHRERFLGIWKQIAERYKDQPENMLVFEPLNEPFGDQMTVEVWNDLALAALATIRQSNPARVVMFGPTNWNSVDKIDTLQLPEEDRRLIVTFHYYLPFQFTHQGAEWQQGSEKWLGTTWRGTEDEKAAVDRDMDFAAQWAEKNRRPIFMGEFGAYHTADMQSRANWTAYVARQAEARGFAWAYWEFCSGFGIYDPQAKVFWQPLVEALIPPQ